MNWLILRLRRGKINHLTSERSRIPALRLFGCEQVDNFAVHWLCPETVIAMLRGLLDPSALRGISMIWGHWPTVPVTAGGLSRVVVWRWWSEAVLSLNRCHGEIMRRRMI